MGLYRKILFGLAFVGIVWLLTIHTFISNSIEDHQKEKREETLLPLTCNKVSIVYTWVNGSDPDHIAARVQRSGSTAYASPGNNRFRDLGGLLYSLRGLEKHAPWIEDIFIVTSGQIPGFLDLSHKNIHIIPHSQIFPNPSDLPTFSSNAIEASFHNLPDSVGDCFIYLNDDMFFANTVTLADFWTPEQGQILYKSSWTAPPPESRMNNIWHRSVGYSNTLLDKLWGHAERNYASHGPYFFSLKVLRHLYDVLASEFNATTARPFRYEKDVSIPFLYNQFTTHYYQSVTADKTINTYLKMTDNEKQMRKDFDRILDRQPKSVCLNDALGNEPNAGVVRAMHSFFHKLFPTKSKYELHEDEYM
jgi:hypothetical protein